MSVLVVLGLIWTAVLLPPFLRARAGRRAEFMESIREPNGAAEVRAGEKPEQLARVRRKSSPAERRRDILGGLLGALIGSLVLGAVPSLRPVWVLFLFLLNVFIGYVALLAHQRTLALRRQGRLPARPAPAPASASAPARERAVRADARADARAEARSGRALKPALESR